MSAENHTLIRHKKSSWSLMSKLQSRILNCSVPSSISTLSVYLKINSIQTILTFSCKWSDLAARTISKSK